MRGLNSILHSMRWNEVWQKSKKGLSKVLIKLTPLSEATYLPLEKLSRMRCDEYNTFKQTRIQGRFGLWGLGLDGEGVLGICTTCMGMEAVKKKDHRETKSTFGGMRTSTCLRQASCQSSDLAFTCSSGPALSWFTPHSYGLERDHPLEALNAPSCN